MDHAAILRCLPAFAALWLAAGCAAPPYRCAEAPDLDEAGCAAVRGMALPDALPPARGNAYGDSEAAAVLGFQAFFRADLGHGVSCATCHDPTFSFTDRRPTSTGHSGGRRNTPTTLNAARQTRQFWDGRADSLWSQPLFALENPAEMATSRVEVAHFLASDPLLGPLYAKAFGPLPDLSALPATGKPGDPAYDALPEAARDLANRIAVNLGKAFEAYLRKNTSAAAPLDRYLRGDASALSPTAARGLSVFAKAGCASCHAGPLLSDGAFHVVGLSQGSAELDLGAAEGVPVLAQSPFTLVGKYADPVGGPFEPPDESTAVAGAFRTPSLRRVAETPPYGHDGSIATLDDLLKLHAPKQDEGERGLLIAFLRSLTGELPPRPWSTWPSPQ